MGPAWVASLTALVVAVGALLAWVTRWGWRLATRTTHFLDAFFGEPARDGMEAKPGVMARLRSVEDMVHAVAAETRPNGGNSLRDVLARVERDVTLVKTDQGEMRRRIELFEANRAGREGTS